MSACVTNLSSINVDIASVRAILVQLRESAAGPDDLPAIVFKRLAYWLAVPLTIIYQQSIHQERIPNDWKRAKVTAIFKGKGDTTDPSNYRPISLTAVAFKMLERIVVGQMQQHLSANNNSSTSQ